MSISEKILRACVAVLFLAAPGCQEMHELSKIDPLVGAPRPGAEQLVDVAPGNAASGGANGQSGSSGPSQSTVASSSSAPTSQALVHFVSYAPPPDASGAVASATVGQQGANGVASSPASSPASGLASPSWLAGESRPSGRRWDDLFVARGQTPARSVFVSDRVLMGAIVIAAIVIPYAIHDSRQPNPPHQ